MLIQEDIMRKIWSILLLLVMLASLCVLAVHAEEEDEEISLWALLNTPKPTPDP